MPFRNLLIQTNSNKDSGNYSCKCRFVALIVRPNWRTITVGLGDFCHSNNLFLWKAENVLGKQRFVCHPVHREQSICHRVEGWPHDKPFYYTDTGFTVFSQQPGSGWWKYNWLGMPKYLEGWSIFHCQLLWLSCSVHSFTFCISVSFKLCASQSAPLNPKAVPGQPFRLLYLFPTAALNSSSHNTDSS